MLAGAALSGACWIVLGLLLRRRLGTFAAVSLALLGWSLTVIALVTLIPAYGAPGVVPAEGHATTCATDIGGPAPQGFWILGSGQRLLNTVLFLPSGLLVVFAAQRWWPRWLLILLGWLALVAYSVLIETVQLELARIDRACDLTDVVDNGLGAGLGVLLGIAVAALFRLRRRARRAVG